MSLRKKILILLGGVLCFLLVLLAVAIFLTPVYLNSASAKAKIEAAISGELGGTVRYQRLDISIYPHPHVVFQETRLAIPKTARGTLKSISIYPQILPLLKGDLFVSRIRVHEPNLTIALPETVSEVKPESLSLPEVKKNIRLVLNSLTAIGPGLIVEMDKGTLVLRRKGYLFLSLRDAAVRFNAPPGVMDITLKAVTEPWGAFSMSGKYSFTEERSEVKDLSVSMGRTSISGFSARLAWGKTPYLEIDSGRAAFALDEMYQWLTSSETFTAYLEDVRSLSGMVTVSSMQAGVPLYRPAASHMTVAGEMKHVVLDSGLLPAPLTVTGRFVLKETKIAISGLSARMSKSSLSSLSAYITDRKNPALKVLSGRAVIDLGEIFHWRKRYGVLSTRLKDIRALSGIVRLSSLHIGGPLFEPAHWILAFGGNVEQISLDSPLLPALFAASRGGFDLSPGKLALTDVQAAILDATIIGSGALNGDREGLHAIDLTFAGTAGRESIAWFFTRFALPAEFTLNAPLAFANSHLTWQEKQGTSFAGTVTVANGPVLSLDLSKTGTELAVRRAVIKDRDTNATVSVRQSESATDLSFSGKLAQTTLNRIFVQQTEGKGKIRGNLRTTLHRDRPLDSTAQGTLSGEDIAIPWGLAVPLTIDTISLRAQKNVLTVDSAALTWGNSHYSAYGNVTATDSGLVLDMDLGADTIDVSAIQQALSRPGKKSPDQKARPSRMPPVLGVVRVNSLSLLFGRYTFSPTKAVVTLSPHGVSMAFTEAKTCGISILGTLAFSGSEVNFDFKPSSAKLPLEATLDCLAGKDVRITGTYDLSGDIRAQGKSGTLVKSIEGNVDFKSRDGKIYRYPVLAKIFSVLSVLEIFRGRLPELGGNGFPYHSMAVKGKLHQGKFILEKAYIGGKSVDIIAQGEADLAAQKLDLVVLVAPFSTINWIIRHIPLVSSIMGGTLISVPVKVSGDLSNPDVTFLAPSAVGTRLLNLLENILELPVKIISPILPKEKEKQQQ
jgi:hypothetical protein